MVSTQPGICPYASPQQSDHIFYPPIHHSDHEPVDPQPKNQHCAGCVTCHNGVVIGGNSYRKIGLVEPYETDDLGRYEVTHVESDKKVFKVPSLRNIAKTAPYFHDGSVESLDEAIRLMAKHQLGQDADSEFIEDVKAFLGSLTGKD